MQLRDLHRQYEAMKAEMDEALLRTANSGTYIMGDAVANLEQQLADYVGVKHCIACANGTDALRMALMAWDIGKGDAVFVPDFTFFASAEVVALQGATPIFVDVNRDDYNINSDDLIAKVSHIEKNTNLRPAVVIAVDLFGQPANHTVLTDICRSRRMLLLEDGAQGFGGAIGSEKACSFGDISATSFFPAKPLGCYGDGGAVFTDNDEWAQKIRSLRVHGKGSDKYDNIRIGLNSRLDTIQAAVLQVKLKHFDSEVVAVNRIAQLYHSLLDGTVVKPTVNIGYTSSWAQYTVQCHDRDALQQRLREEGIPSAIYYPRPLHLQSAFSGILPLQQPCPTAERLSSEVLSLPMHPYLTDKEVEIVAHTINTIQKHCQPHE